MRTGASESVLASCVHTQQCIGAFQAILAVVPAVSHAAASKQKEKGFKNTIFVEDGYARARASLSRGVATRPPLAPHSLLMRAGY
eukprot:2570761-Prymnesium_polylepis.1